MSTHTKSLRSVEARYDTEAPGAGFALRLSLAPTHAYALAGPHGAATALRDLADEVVSSVEAETAREVVSRFLWPPLGRACAVTRRIDRESRIGQLLVLDWTDKDLVWSADLVLTREGGYANAVGLGVGYWRDIRDSLSELLAVPAVAQVESSAARVAT